MPDTFTVAEKLADTTSKHAIDAVVQKILEGYLLLGEDAQIVLDIQSDKAKRSFTVSITVKDLPMARVLHAYAGLCKPVQLALPFKGSNDERHEDGSDSHGQDHPHTRPG